MRIVGVCRRPKSALVAMPPKRQRPKRFDYMRGDFNGVPYTLSEDGRLVVGSKKGV